MAPGHSPCLPIVDDLVCGEVDDSFKPIGSPETTPTGSTEATTAVGAMSEFTHGDLIRGKGFDGRRVDQGMRPYPPRQVLMSSEAQQ